MHEDIKSLESFNLVMRQGTLFKSCICGFYKPGISSPCGPVAAFGARGVQSWGRRRGGCLRRGGLDRLTLLCADASVTLPLCPASPPVLRLQGWGRPGAAGCAGFGAGGGLRAQDAERESGRRPEGRSGALRGRDLRASVAVAQAPARVPHLAAQPRAQGAHSEPQDAPLWGRFPLAEPVLGPKYGSAVRETGPCPLRPRGRTSRASS